MLNQELLVTRAPKLSISRRSFLHQGAMAGLLSSGRAGRLLAGSQQQVDAASAAPIDALAVVRNRAPLAANAFYQLPLGSIRPAG